jgi:rhamnulokinase
MTSKTRRYLAFDLGAESGRAVAGILEEGRLECREIYRFPNRSVEMNGHLYWNVLGIYDQILEGLRTCARDFSREMHGIGVDSWGVDYCLLDARGDLAGNAFHYRDGRTEGTPELIEAHFGTANLYSRTGIQMLPINTINQMIAAVREGDPLLGVADVFLFMGDFFHYCLTGVKRSEFTVASISQLYNNQTREWDDEIFKAFNIPRKIAPELIQAGSVIGDLKAGIAGEADLAPVRVMAPAVHDTASAAVSIPVTGRDWAFLSAGTWCMVGLELDNPVTDERSMRFNISNSGGVLGKNLYLKNVMGLWILQQCKRTWNRKDPEIGYPELVRQAAAASGFYALIDPDDLRFLNAADTPGEVVRYCRRTDQRIPDPEDAGQVTRIILESLALKFRWVLERLMEGAGREVKEFYIIGGGSRNDLLNQFTADALGVRVHAGPQEASSMGNIMMQAVGDGVVGSLGEVRRIIRASCEVRTYEPENKQDWNKAYQGFRSMIEN